MTINTLQLNGFGKFIDKTIELDDGVNVVYGKNEAGKSTTHTFIKCMLFGMKKKKAKSQNDIYQKYLPWDKNCKYEGHLTFTHNNKKYEIHRIFNETKPILELRDLSKNTLIDNPQFFINKALSNLTMESFDNTISIGQMKTAQDGNMITDLQRYIANLNTSGDITINTVGAISYLKMQRESLIANLKSDAAIIYNRQLGNIRNIEKELSGKTYENHLADIIKKKNIENKKIEENNTKIDKLKQDISTKTIQLDNFGFTSKDDIDSLSLQTNKIFIEYSPLITKKNLLTKLFVCSAMAILGIIMIIISTLLLVVTYPDIAKLLSVSNSEYSLQGLTNFVMSLPFHPIVLISLLLCLGIILIIGDIILIIINYQNIGKGNELKHILSEIFNQQINDDVVTHENMKLFKKHMSNMKNLAKKIEDDEASIITITKENNKLLSKQKDYDEKIQSQQQIQYDVEQKYNELNELRVESEKTKKDLVINDNVNKEIESIDLAIETLSTLSDEIQVAFGTHLNKSASKYIEGLTNGKYNSLNVDNSLNVTINYEGKVIPLSQVSTGTIDQIYLAMRLATTDIIRGNKESLPLLFDDCFAMYDNERLEASLKFLKKNIQSQIIIFTCHTREAGFLGHNNISYNKIEI